MPDTTPEILQGTLDLLILRVVHLEPIHGYAIAQRIKQRSKDVLTIQQGSLYPALHRLERQGWLKAEWGKTESGREAKYYQLTKSGEKQLSREQENWDRMTTAIGLVLGGS
jgi:transcriptional regulator